MTAPQRPAVGKHTVPQPSDDIQAPSVWQLVTRQAKTLGGRSGGPKVVELAQRKRLAPWPRVAAGCLAILGVAGMANLLAEHASFLPFRGNNVGSGSETVQIRTISPGPDQQGNPAGAQAGDGVQAAAGPLGDAQLAAGTAAVTGESGSGSALQPTGEAVGGVNPTTFANTAAAEGIQEPAAGRDAEQYQAPQAQQWQQGGAAQGGQAPAQQPAPRQPAVNPPAQPQPVYTPKPAPPRPSEVIRIPEIPPPSVPVAQPKPDKTKPDKTKPAKDKPAKGKPDNPGNGNGNGNNGNGDSNGKAKGGGQDNKPDKPGKKK